MATIIVGSEKVVFRVLLNHISAVPFFAKAFSNTLLKEGQTHEITLVDEEPATFRLFLRWIYQGYNSDEAETTEESLMTWTKLYIMLDKRLMLDLAKDVFTITNNTLPRSLHRKTLVDCLKVAQVHEIRFLFINHLVFLTNVLPMGKAIEDIEDAGLLRDLLTWHNVTSVIESMIPEDQRQPSTVPGIGFTLGDEMLLAVLFADESLPQPAIWKADEPTDACDSWRRSIFG